MRYFHWVTYFLLLFTVRSFSQPTVFPDPVQCDIFHSNRYDLFPPLRSDMPFDVMVSWIVLDSICKSTSNVQLALQSTTDDSLRSALRYLYRVSDYDPFLIYQYLTDFLHLGKKWKRPYGLISYVLKEYESRFGPSKQLRKIFETDMIHYVKVLSKSSYTYHDTITHRFSTVQYCVNAEILTKFKGQTVYMKDPESDLETITLGWNRFDSSAYGSNDSVYMAAHSENLLETNKEYLVFIRTKAVGGYSQDNSWYHSLDYLEGDIRAVFPVVNGLVNDESNFFGLGKNVALETILAHLHTLVITVTGN